MGFACLTDFVFCWNAVYKRANKFKLHVPNYGILQMNTVLSEIKKRNTKYLRKCENHTNALAVNQLREDKSDTTHRLKRYTVLTLPDRPK
jgi:Iap family predicted aminopeptidase